MKTILFLKAQSIPAGARWITVKAPGHEKGQPLLIQPNADGSAHVIGGAGGSMNYLKLRAVKSESDYKKEAEQKRAAKTEEKKEQRKKDKAAGLVESKKAARQNIKAQAHEHERTFVRTVARAMKWDEKELEFPEEAVKDLSDVAQAKARNQHHSELLARANEAVDVQRKRLVDDAAARMEGGIGEIPLETKDPEVLSVEDINPVKQEGGGLGFAPQYKERAEAAGLKPEDLKAEADQAKAVKQAAMTPAQRNAAVARGETAKMVATELKAIREPLAVDAPIQLADAKTAVELLKAQKQLKQLHKKAQAANREIDKSAAEPKAYVIEYTADPEADAKVESDIEGDLRSMKTRAFLSEFQRLAGEAPGESLGKHIGVGAYNSINSLALAVGGEALVDRSVVDVLGIAGAAQVLARRIHNDLPEDVERITDGMQEFHIDHYMKESESALSDARDLMAAAKEIEIGELASSDDLQAGQELNARRRRAVNDAQKVLGQALGEMEANAALVTSLKQGKKDNFQVSLGKASIESAIQQVRAIGLQKGDYSIDDVAGDKFLTVNAAGLDRLAKPVNRADVEQVRRNIAIIRGDEDVDGWLPKGVANRPDLAMDVKAGAAPALSEPFAAGDDLEQSLRDYIGGRTADGDTPGDIVSDIQSAQFFQKAGTGRAEAYRAALDAVAPLKGVDGKQQRAEALADQFDGYADKFVESRFGGKRSTLNRQQFKVDQKSVDALHRALAETPEGTAAYKPIGELTPLDQRAIREFFHRNVARESPDAADLRQELEKHAAAQPDAETTDMFGDTVPNPTHGEWKAKRDELAGKVNSASLTWAKYVESMHGNAGAYEAIQDLIRSKVGASFAEAHNKLNPGAPIKVGRQVIRNNLNHLDATDPVAREARLAKDRAMVDSLRERSGGRYASGAVSDKFDAARDQKEAMEQAQMGFFAEEAPPDAVKEIAADERHSVGHAAERQIAGMMGIVGKNFKPGAPTKLWAPTMSGGKNAARQRLVRLVEANKRVVAAFGTGCVHGHTILEDAENRGWTFFDWWRSGEKPTVFGMDENTGVLHSVAASDVFVKGVSPMIKMTLENGCSIVGTKDHRIFSKVRGWIFMGEVKSGEAIASSMPSEQSFSDERLRALHPTIHTSQIGHHLTASQQVAPAELGAAHLSTYSSAGLSPLRLMRLCRLLTNSERGLSVHRADARRLSRKDEDYQDHFSACQHQRGGQPPFGSVGGQFLRPLLSGAQGCSHSFEHSDALGHAQEHSHSCPNCGRLSKMGSYRQGMSQLDGAQFHKTSSSSVSSADQHRKVVPTAMMSFVRSDTDVSVHQMAVVSFSSVVCVSSCGLRVVFDISVPNYNSYTANGIVHHNSGKSLLQLASFTHLKEQGKAKRGLFLVPSIVQGQFSGEALRYLEPGKFNWHIQPGASREERIAAYKNPEHDFAVMTHQSFRDDMLHLGAQHAGVPPGEMSARLNAMTDGERKEWMGELMKREGINFDYLTVDESQNTLNRAGKENSGLANVVDALSQHTPHYLLASGTPVKNDASEVYDLLRKMDPSRYSDRAAFMRRYGADTLASKDALKREMARFVYPSKIDPDVEADRRTETVQLSAGQKLAMSELDKHFSEARIARMQGKVDVAAMRAISPSSFEGVPDDKQEEVAGDLQENLGILKASATQRVINTHADNAKVDHISKMAADRKGKPGVVFAHSLDAVKAITERLEKEGHRVVSLTGADSSTEKERKRLMFNPEQGEAQADILIASDAGATGMNIQRGQWLVQMDIPMTSMVHAQRNGRVFRTGQLNDVELTDLVADHPDERRARDRLAKKYALGEVMSSPMDGLDDTGVAGFLNRARANKQQMSL